MERRAPLAHPEQRVGRQRVEFLSSHIFIRRHGSLRYRELNVETRRAAVDEHCAAIRLQRRRVDWRDDAARVRIQKVGEYEPEPVRHALRTVDEANAVAFGERNAGEVGIYAVPKAGERVGVLHQPARRHWVVLQHCRAASPARSRGHRYESRSAAT